MGRLGVVGMMAVLFVVVPFGRQAVELYTDWLWFDEVGFSGVFRTILSTKVLLGLGAGVVAFLVLYLNVLATRRGLGPPVLDLDAEETLPQLPELVPGRAALPPIPSARLPRDRVHAERPGDGASGRR